MYCESYLSDGNQFVMVFMNPRNGLFQILQMYLKIVCLFNNI